jgi:hypothetical protein
MRMLKLRAFFKTLPYEDVYNKKRLQSSIECVPPEEYEASMSVKNRNEKTELLSAITN